MYNMMYYYATFSLLALLAIVTSVTLACEPGVVVYWGQNSYGVTNSGDKSKWEGRLSDYCNSGVVGTVVISFMHVFGQGKAASANLGNHCDSSDVYKGTEMPKCSSVQDDVKTCRAKGVKVEIALGGATGSYGFSNDDDGAKFAEELNDLVFSGKGEVRPFGDQGLDGVNLDIENGNPKGYTGFVKRLREISPTTRISAAPQCVLDSGPVDAVYVQFYNNACGVQAYGTDAFNFGQWADWSHKKAAKKGAKIYLGVPGSKSAAGSGYIEPDKLNEISYSDVFGGVMLWDASQAFNNQVNGKSYAQSTYDSLKQVC
ncbi:glycoside hydrolase superfamily [Syncephalis plumigaleata]|nr:glycoside hydrolase superfamily [Syncephalis plumigaleata]